TGLRYKTKSEAHWTALILRYGWEPSPYWEESGRSCLCHRARPVGPRGVSREMPDPRRELEACRTVALGRGLTPVSIRTRDDGADRPGYRPTTRVATRSSGTGFRNGLTWAAATGGGYPVN